MRNTFFTAILIGTVFTCTGQSVPSGFLKSSVDEEFEMKSSSITSYHPDSVLCFDWDEAAYNWKTIPDRKETFQYHDWNSNQMQNNSTGAGLQIITHNWINALDQDKWFEFQIDTINYYGNGGIAIAESYERHNDNTFHLISETQFTEEGNNTKMLYAIWDFRANKYWRGYDQRWSYNPCQLITVSSFAELDTALQVWKISRIDSTQYLYDTIPVKSICREYEADTTKTIAVSVFSPIDDTTTEITTTLWEGEYQQQSGIRKEHIVKSPATATSYHIFLREKSSGSWEPYYQVVTAPITLNINGIELEGSNETEQFIDPILEEWINISRNLILHNPQATCYMFEDWIADEWRTKRRALFYYNLAGSDSLWVFSSFDPTNSNYNLTDVTEYCYQNDKLHYKTLRRIEDGNSSWISIWRYYYPEGYGIINQSNNRAGLVCYPNPTTGSIHFIVGDPYTEVFIYDSEGKLCQKETLESGIQQMDFSHLRPGFYVMVVAGQSQKSWQRIIRL